MINLKALKEETDKLSVIWSEYEMELQAEHSRISKLDLSKYSEEYQPQERERLWMQGAEDRSTAFRNVEKHCNEIENKLKPTYDNVSMLEQRKRFASDKGLTLMEANHEINRYVNDPRIPVEDILDESNPYRRIFEDELKRSKRIEEKVILSDTHIRQEVKNSISYMKKRIQELRDSTFERFDYTGGDAMINLLKTTQP